jgi:hypothetical protein
MPLFPHSLKKLECSRCRPPGAFQCVILFLAILPHAHSQEIPVGFNVQRYATVWERNPFALAKEGASQLQVSAFEKLHLASWLIEGGKEVVCVENSETKEVQRIAAQPNQNNMRLIEIHLHPDSRFVEAVILNGNEKGIVKFRYDDQVSPELTNSGLQNNVQTNQVPRSRIYPGLPRVNMEGGPRQGASGGPAFRRKKISPDPAPAPPSKGWN